MIIKFFLSFFAILFFNSTQTFAYEVKNFGLICMEISESDRPIFEAIWFTDDNKVEFYIETSTSDEEFEIRYNNTVSYGKEYKVYESYILISKFDFEGKRVSNPDTIDRFTLKRVEENEMYNLKSFFQCELQETKESFFSEIKIRENIIRRYFKKRKI